MQFCVGKFVMAIPQPMSFCQKFFEKHFHATGRAEHPTTTAHVLFMVHRSSLSQATSLCCSVLEQTGVYRYQHQNSQRISGAACIACEFLRLDSR